MGSASDGRAGRRFRHATPRGNKPLSLGGSSQTIVVARDNNGICVKITYESKGLLKLMHQLFVTATISYSTGWRLTLDDKRQYRVHKPKDTLRSTLLKLSAEAQSALQPPPALYKVRGVVIKDIATTLLTAIFSSDDGRHRYRSRTADIP